MASVESNERLFAGESIDGAPSRANDGRRRVGLWVEANAVPRRTKRAPKRHRARRRRASTMLDRVVNTRGLVPGRPAPRAGCRASPPSSPRHERSATRPPRLRTRSNAAPPPGRVALTDSRPRRVIRTLSSKDTDQRGALGCDALAARAHGHRRASGAQGEGQTTAQGKSPYVVPLRDSDFLRGDARREQLDAANRVRL